MSKKQIIITLFLIFISINILNASLMSAFSKKSSAITSSNQVKFYLAEVIKFPGIVITAEKGKKPVSFIRYKGTLKVVKIEGKYCKVLLPWGFGYVEKKDIKFLKKLSLKPAAPPAKKKKAKIGIVSVGTSSLNVRTSPWGKIIGSLYTGNKVEIIGEKRNWYKIKYKGKTAYVHKHYVLVKGKRKSPCPETLATVKVNSSLNVRKSPWGKIIGSLKNNDKVFIVGQTKNWYKIKWGSSFAYVYKSYIVKGSPSKTKPEHASKPSAPASNSKSYLKGRPIDGGRVSSNYGYRIHPIKKVRKFHSGIDIAAPLGTNCRAIGKGTVIFAGWCGGYGRLVKIKYDNGYVAYYAHLKDYAGMKPGKRVKPGDVVGHVNSSGYSTGNHLHFEIRKNNKPVNPRSVPGVVI